MARWLGLAVHTDLTNPNPFRPPTSTASLLNHTLKDLLPTRPYSLLMSRFTEAPGAVSQPYREGEGKQISIEAALMQNDAIHFLPLR